MTSKIEKVAQKHADLVTHIREWDRAYYVEAAPLISDQAYDQAYQELVALEQAYPFLQTLDSPTQRVGGQPLQAFTPVRHTIPMMSLDNTYSQEDLGKFIDRVEKALNGKKISWIIEPKIDGVAVSVRYLQGRFSLGATRGDGTIGDNITENLRTIRHLPLQLNKTFPLLEIRGEVYFPRAAFSQLNTARQQAGEPLFANPRNAAAGSLKQLDPALVAQRPLAIVLYGVGALEGITCHTQQEWLHILRDLGLPVPQQYWLCSDREEIFHALNELASLRQSFPYDIDGAVIKVNPWSLHSTLGSTAKAPRWAMAYKYQAEQAVTLIKGVSFQIGRTGVITPVAELEPVTLAGSTISRATLHNFEEIRRKDIRIGDHALIEKAGEVIPAVLASLPEKRTGKEIIIEPPQTHPECSGPLIWDGLFLRCTDLHSPAILKRRLYHFAQRGAMDIEGLGPSLIDQLVDNQLVHNLADLYNLTHHDLASLERMAAKSAKNLLNSLEASKSRELWRLLFGLGIHHIGAGAARLLETHFPSLDALSQATHEQLLALHEIGDVMAASLLSYFADPLAQQQIERLRQAGLNFQSTSPPLPFSSSALQGKTIVITGTLSEPRDTFAQKIRAAGGKVASQISAKTNYLLAGDRAGSKQTRAEKLQIPIIDEAAFHQLLHHTSPQSS